MQRNSRRGFRPLSTVLVSERRVGGIREFTFSDAQSGPRSGSAQPGQPLRALMSARAFSWSDDVPAANDASIEAVDAAPNAAGAEDRDFKQFLAGLRRVYRTPHRRS